MFTQFLCSKKINNNNNKELLPFATAWVELETIMLNDISQLVKDKYPITSLTTGI